MEKSIRAGDMLRLIYDKIHRVKGEDLYIVESGGIYGVVDATGDSVIPLEYSRITYSSIGMFRVYGDFIAPGVPLKNQGLIDKQGKVLFNNKVYEQTIRVLDIGLLYGNLFMDSGLCNKEIIYVNRDGGMHTFDSSTRLVKVLEELPGLLVCIRDDNKLYSVDILNNMVVRDCGYGLTSLYSNIEQIDIGDNSVVSKLKDNGYTDSMIEDLRFVTTFKADTQLGEYRGRKVVIDNLGMPLLSGKKYSKEVYR